MNARRSFLNGIAAKALHASPIEPRSVSQAAPALNAQTIRNVERSLQLEFPFTMGDMPLSEPDAATSLGLFQWLKDQIMGTDARRTDRHLILVLHVAATLDGGLGLVWKELAATGGLRADRRLELEQLLTSRSVAGIRVAPYLLQISDSFEPACTRQDWKAISEAIPHIIEVLYDPVLSNAARALDAMAPSSMEGILAKIGDVPLLMLIIEALDESVQRTRTLQLAAASENWSLKFLALRLSLEHAKRGTPAEFHDVWVQLLCQAAHTEEHWPIWTAIFNAYPFRYPVLQRAMGRALCTIPAPAIVQYFGAIELSCAGSRRDLAQAFAVLRQHADEDRRKLVWRLAYEQWSAWNFFGADAQRGLTSVQTSCLDPAVAAFYQEGVSVHELDSHEDRRHAEFLEIRSDWHETLSDYKTAINRHLSRFQPLAHAKYQLCGEDDWLAGKKAYIPKWLKDQEPTGRTGSTRHISSSCDSIRAAPRSGYRRGDLLSPR